jgi:hypothetical protein
MAATLTKETSLQGKSLKHMFARDSQVFIGTILFDDSYPTGGEAVSFGFTPDFVIAEPVGGYVFSWDYSAEKLEAYYYDYDAGSDGAAIEVANATDLSSVTCRVLAIKV